LQWSVPRELLWAIIGTLTIFVIALWPSYYPYSQTPQVQTQHKTENGVGGDNPSKHESAAQIDPSSPEKGERSGEHASELTILGIKPNEWLLSIVTLMLWGATVGLVRGGDKTAERQLRAYVFVKNGRMDRLQGSILRADISLENGGQTPAYDLIYKGRVFIVPPETLGEIGPFSEEMVVIGPRSPSPIQITGRVPLSLEHQHAYETGALKIIVLGVIRYRDAFDKIQTTEFGFEVFGDVWGSKGHLRQIKGQYKQT